MSFLRGIDGGEPLRPERAGGGPGLEEERRAARSTLVATGTLACPRCDAPVAPAGAMAPSDPLGCPYCPHTARVRDFLSLAPPARPARVDVRIVLRAGAGPRRRPRPAAA